MRAPNVTYKTVWHSCVIHACANRYVHNGLASMRAPNVAYTMVWHPCVRQTLRTQWFGIHACAKRYVQNGFAAVRAREVAYKTVLYPCVRQTYIMVCHVHVRPNVRAKCFGIHACARCYVQSGLALSLNFPSHKKTLMIQMRTTSQWQSRSKYENLCANHNQSSIKVQTIDAQCLLWLWCLLVRCYAP